MDGNLPHENDEHLSSIDIWADDRLERKEQAEFLKTFLLNRVKEKIDNEEPASYVLNLNAEWGEGKSFFLHRFAIMLRAEGYLVAEVNAWSDDHADDPLLAVIDAIDLTVKPLTRKSTGKAKKAWNAVVQNGGTMAVALAKGVATQLTKKYAGDIVQEIAEIVDGSPHENASEKVADALAKSVGDLIDKQGKALLEGFREGKRTINSFRESVRNFLESVSDEQKLPIFVFVDELDRCRPPFAIAMLERIKHLFDIDRVIFVVATDTKQLSHSIRAVYGSGFNSEGYLARFFNRTYQFERLSKRQLTEEIWNRLPIDTAKISMPPHNEPLNYLCDAFDFFNLTTRDIEQTYDIIRTFVTTWSAKSATEFLFLVPLAIAHQKHFPLPVATDFSTNMKRLAADLGGGKTSWAIHVLADRFGRNFQRINVHDALNSFARTASHSLDILYESTPGSVFDHWVLSRLREEHQSIHGGIVNRTPPPYSIILRYSDLLRSAGRLTVRD